MFEIMQAVAAERSVDGALDADDQASGLSLLNRELLHANRVADHQLGRDETEWLAKGFRAYLAGKGRLSLERCLHLPSNDASRQRAVRDYWLRVAWTRVAGTLTPWCRSESLASAIKRFRTTQWIRWKDLKSAAAAEASLDEALLEAFRSHDRIPSTAMQLHNIAQHDACD